MKRSRIIIVISGYKLKQEAQLLNERFDLNTGINSINLPSIGVHTSLAQVYPTLGGSSIINQGFSSCPQPHKEEPHKKDRIASHVLTNTGRHRSTLRIWSTAFKFPSLSFLPTMPWSPRFLFFFSLMSYVTSGCPKFLDSELSQTYSARCSNITMAPPFLSYWVVRIPVP